MVRIPRQWSLKLWETGKASSKRLELQQRASESATWTPAELISQRRRHDTLPIEKIDRLYTYRRQWSLNAFHPITSNITNRHHQQQYLTSSPGERGLSGDDGETDSNFVRCFDLRRGPDERSGGVIAHHRPGGQSQDRPRPTQGTSAVSAPA